MIVGRPSSLPCVDEAEQVIQEREQGSRSPRQTCDSVTSSQKWHTSTYAMFYWPRGLIPVHGGRGLQEGVNPGSRDRWGPSQRLATMDSPEKIPPDSLPGVWSLAVSVWGTREERSGAHLSVFSFCFVLWFPVQFFTPSFCSYSWHLTVLLLFGQSLQKVQPLMYLGMRE